MAYVTGTANSLSDLLTSIRTACTSNGWTLSGDVLHKGTCYAEVKLGNGGITIRGGTGVDGSNNLTGATNAPTRDFANQMSGQGFTLPATYFAHVLSGPDEVYIVVNYAVSWYQALAFGQSATAGLVGTGNWYSGNTSRSSSDGVWVMATGNNNVTAATAGLFYHDYFTDSVGSVDHQLDSAGWVVEGAWRDWASLFFRQPNQWNGESILIPVRVYASRPAGFVSPVLECAHARFVNIANLSDQQIIALGSDKWVVYPWLKRSSSNRAPGSWYAGHAIRYDGP